MRKTLNSRPVTSLSNSNRPTGSLDTLDSRLVVSVSDSHRPTGSLDTLASRPTTSLSGSNRPTRSLDGFVLKRPCSSKQRGGVEQRRNSRLGTRSVVAGRPWQRARRGLSVVPSMGLGEANKMPWFRTDRGGRNTPLEQQISAEVGTLPWNSRYPLFLGFLTSCSCAFPHAFGIHLTALSFGCVPARDLREPSKMSRSYETCRGALVRVTVFVSTDQTRGQHGLGSDHDQFTHLSLSANHDIRNHVLVQGTIREPSRSFSGRLLRLLDVSSRSEATLHET